MRPRQHFRAPWDGRVKVVTFGFLALAVLAVLTTGSTVALPVVLIACLVAAFGVPALWVRMAPDSRKSAKSWSRFQAEGIQTAFGPVTAGQATVQVLILPVLIFLWGIAAVTIAALV